MKPSASEYDWFRTDDDASSIIRDEPTATAAQAGIKAPMSRRRLEVFRKHYTGTQEYALVLLTIAIDLYGGEFLEWTPEAIRLQIEDDLNVRVPQENLDKLMAAVAILTTDDYQRDVARFIHITNVLCDDRFDPSTFDPATVGECAWGVLEAALIRPPEPGEEYDPEIRKYVELQMREEGLSKLPRTLSQLFANDGQRGTDSAVPASDDPAMFAAFFSSMSDEADAIDSVVNENVGQLLTTLSALPLANGDASTVTRFLQQREQ